MLKKGDMLLGLIILIIIILSYAGVALFKDNNNDTQRIAVIKQGDKEVERINLDKITTSEEIIISADYEVVILVEKGRIRFMEADCPDGLCVKTGWLTEKGDMAVCLPNRLMIKIEGESKDVDIVTY